MTDNRQLAAWTGSFGSAYLERCSTIDAAEMESRRTALATVFHQLPDSPVSILEVGTNVGKNLMALAKLTDAELHGVEPLEEAFKQLRTNLGDRLTSAYNQSGFNLPYEDESIDFVFTSGVLIHVAPERLSNIMSEIVRVSRRWIWCNEYFAKQPKQLSYRGETGLLWKRDFGRSYMEHHPNLRPCATGFFWRGTTPFDDTTWWLFEKV